MKDCKKSHDLISRFCNIEVHVAIDIKVCNRSHDTCISHKACILILQ